MPSSVLETLAQGGLIICANARAARALGKQYGKHAAQEGQRAWQTPRIFDSKQWLHAQWMQLLLSGKEDRTLLSPLQEEILWNEIVEPGVEGRSLIAAADVARLAMSGYSLLYTYDAARYLQREWDHASLEPELFRRWALEMERRCERNHWLCEAKLPWEIADALRDSRLPAPIAILWNGFDRLTPVDNAFRQALEEGGCVQTELAWQLEAAEQLIAAPSVRDEFEACALWAREQLETDPAKTIGILLPDIEGARAELDRVFRRVLSMEKAAEAAALTQQAARPLYEFTLGMPLADVPAIAAALALLRWCIEPQQQETITWLMTTSFFAPAGDSAILAEADIRMRKRLSAPELEMGEALLRISKFASPSGGNWAVANWVRGMGRALKVCQAAQGRDRHCAQWVPILTSILKETGWPGDGENNRKDSIHFQVLERWQRVLEEISALGFSDKRYDFAEFLRLLTSHLRATIFSPESLDQPITISGILESAGLSFDAVWILRATDEAWPSTSRMHPLLPAWLQMEANMPGSSTEQDRLLAASTLDRLRNSTPELIYSYSKEGAEGAQRASSQMAHLDEQIGRSASQGSTSLVESFTDEMTVPWPGGRAAGGQEVLKDQSACPFKAFAAKRLSAQELPSLEPGLNAAERGNIVHGTLASMWADTRLGDSAHLRQTTVDGTLPEIVQDHVAVAFKKHDDLASTDWERTYLLLEKERVSFLIRQWLVYEGKRKPFKVARSEEPDNIFIEGLELKIRMDRVDEVKDGRLLIDYKTGKVNASSWESDRPKEPQLPIYAISGKVETLRDVFFAQVRADDIKYVSAVYKSKPDIFPENPSDPDAAACFEEICAQWTEVIGHLSREFQQGIATVTPKEFPETCTYCDFPGLCRVAELIGMTSENGDDEE